MTIKERAWQRYAVAIGIALAAAALRLAFMEALGTRNAFLTFYPAVVLAALYGGLGPGLVATAVSAVFADYLLFEPIGHFGIRDSADWVSVIVFSACCAMISWIVEAMRRAQTRASNAEFQIKPAAGPNLREQHFDASAEPFSLKGLRKIFPVNALFSAALALLFIVALFTYRDVSLMKEADDLENHTYEVIQALQNLFTSVTEAEGCQSGFLITGDDKYLESYSQIIQGVPSRIDALEKLARDNPAQELRVRQLLPVIQSKLSMLQQSIDARRSQGFEAARQLVDTSSSRILMEDIRNRIAVLDSEERRLLSHRANAKTAGTQAMFQTGLLGGLLSFGLLVLAFRQLRTEISQRIQAEAELRRHRDHLEESIQARTADLQAEVEERKRSEQGLQTSMQRFYSALSNMHGGILLVTNDGKIEFANQSFCNFFDIEAPPSRLIGLSAREVMGRIRNNYKDPESATRRVLEILEKGEPIKGEQVLMEDGRTWLRDFIPITFDGKYHGRLWHHTDITEHKRADKALYDNQLRLQLALKSAQMGTFEWDIVNDKRIWDDHVHALLGTDPKTFSGNADDFFSIIHPDDRKAVQAALDRALKAGFNYETEYRVIWPDESLHYIAARGKVTVSGAGAPLHLLGVCWDISNQKKSEEELRKLNRTLKALDRSNQALNRAQEELDYLKEICKIVVENCGHAMVWVGYAEQDEAKTVRVMAHAGFEVGYLESLGITWADCERGRGPTGTAIRTGKPCGCANMLTDPRFEPWREQAMKRGYASSMVYPLLASGKAFGAITIYSKESDPFSEDESRLLSELADDLANGISTIRARNAEAKARQMLEQNEARFRSMANALPQLAWIAQPDGFIYWYNQRWYDYTGTTPQQMEGWGWQSVHDPEILPKVLAHWKESVDTGEPLEMVFPLRGADGQFRLFLTRVQPMRDPQGRITQWFGTNTDVDELKRAEDALRRSENKFSILFSKASIPAALTRFPDHAFVDVNEAWTELFGYTREELIGKTSLELGIRRDADARSEIINTLNTARGHTPVRDFEQILFSKSGDPITVLTNIDLIELEGQRHALCSLQNITDRKRAEAAFLANRAKLDAALASMTDAVYISDLQGTFIEFNEAFATFHRFRNKKECARTFAEYPNILDVYMADGSLAPVDQWAVTRALRGESATNAIYTLRRKDTGETWVGSYSFAPIRDNTGAIIGSVVAGRDITEQQQIEAALRKSEEGLRLSLREKEVMLKEIHHRVKNNLQVIASLVDMQTNSMTDETLRPLFRDVRDRVRSMAIVHEKLYQSESLAQVDFADYTRSLLNYLWRTHDHSQVTVLLTQELHPVPLSVELAVPCGLILNELVTNAFKHAFRGRQTGEIIARLTHAEDGLITLSIKDDGIGLPPNINWQECRSLGLRLINLLAGQINATVQVRTENGTEFVISFNPTASNE